MSSVTSARQESPATTPVLAGAPWLAPVVHRTQIDVQWLVVALAMLTVGLVFFGWRGMACVCTAAFSTLATYLLAALLMKIIRPHRREDSSLHALVLGLLLGLSLPTMYDMTVPLLAGLLLGILMVFTGRSHRLRLHPPIALAW